MTEKITMDLARLAQGLSPVEKRSELEDAESQGKGREARARHAYEETVEDKAMNEAASRLTVGELMQGITDELELSDGTSVREKIFAIADQIIANRIHQDALDENKTHKK